MFLKKLYAILIIAYAILIIVMEETLEKENLARPPRIDEIIEGKIIGKEKGALFLDLGAYGTGIIYGREFYEARGELKDTKVGDKIFAKVIDLDNEEGYVELSVKEAGEVLAWETLKQKKESGEPLAIKILGANKGGLLAEVLGIAAFLPVSQLSPEHYPRVEGGDTTKILRELQNFIGKDLEVKVFDFSQKEGKLILSEKAKETEKIKEILKNYKVGDVVEGEITGLTNFGAFMKFLPSEALAKEGTTAKDIKDEPVEALASAGQASLSKD